MFPISGNSYEAINQSTEIPTQSQLTFLLTPQQIQRYTNVQRIHRTDNTNIFYTRFESNKNWIAINQKQNTKHQRLTWQDYKKNREKRTSKTTDQNHKSCSLYPNRIIFYRIKCLKKHQKAVGSAILQGPRRFGRENGKLPTNRSGHFEQAF